MEQSEIKIKLTALRNHASNWLRENRGAFDYNSVHDLFSRYDSLRNALQSEYPSLFNDLASRGPEIENIEGALLIRRESLVALLNDCNYCLDILSGVSIVEVPSMKVTREGVFFAGQYFDALQRVRDILEQASLSLVIVDSYVDDKILNLLTSKKPSVDVSILTLSVSPAFKTAALAFKQQYSKLYIRTSKAFHDRFVIVDDRDFYHFGASIKDVGNRGFMFSLIEEPEVKDALRSKFSGEWAKATIEV